MLVFLCTACNTSLTPWGVRNVCHEVCLLLLHRWQLWLPQSHRLPLLLLEQLVGYRKLQLVPDVDLEGQQPVEQSPFASCVG